MVVVVERVHRRGRLWIASQDGILAVGKTLWQKKIRGWEWSSHRIFLQILVKEQQKKYRRAARGRVFTPNSIIKEGATKGRGKYLPFGEDVTQQVAVTLWENQIVPSWKQEVICPHLA